MLGSEHMNTDNILQLSELEKKAILILAENGPMSGYDFHLGGKRQRGNRKALMSSSYWLQVKKRLGPRGENLITKVKLKGRPLKERQGRRKDLFWLTEKGSALALLNNANVKRVKQNALKAFKDEKNRKGIKIYFELREKAGPKVAKLLDKWIVLVGRVEPRELLLRLIPDLASIDESERKELFRIVKKTEYWKYTKEKMKEVIDMLGQEIGP